MRVLGFSEAAVKKAKYSNRNRIGEYQLEWLEPKPEKPAFNRLEKVKSDKANYCFICGEPLESSDKMDHFSIEELTRKGEIIQTHYPDSLYRASQISGISWNALKNARDKGNRIVYRRKIRCHLNWVGELPIYLALKKEEGKKENLGDLEL